MMEGIEKAPPNPSSGEDGKQTGSSKILLDQLLESITTEESKEPAPGVIIRDTYQLFRFLGRGGMGEVWQAVDLIREAGDAGEKDKYVAIKFLSREVRSHPYALKALVREFSRYRRLIHANIVRAYELNRDSDQIYIVLEYLEGESLKEWIKAHPEGTDLKEAEPIIRGMCAGLSFAHRQGILHMDFKPSNVFYDQENCIAKVIDFGIARLSDPAERERTRFDPGQLAALSEAYASPEMLSDVDPDRRDDIYGLACVCYEILSGRHPFDRLNALAASHQGLRPKPIPGVADHQNKILMQGLSFQREDRLDDPEKLYEGLYHRSLSGIPEEGVRMPRFVMPVAAGVTGIMLIMFLVWGVGRWRHLEFEQALIAGEPEAVSEFVGAESREQVNLLQNQQVKEALIHYWLKQPGADLFKILDRLPAEVQLRFLSNLRVRKILIDHALKTAVRYREQGELLKALNELQQLFQRYPDSGSLDDAIQQTQEQILQRAGDLEKRHQHCFRQQDVSCFAEVRTQLLQVAPEHPLLADGKLTQWLRGRSEAALKQGQLDVAASLLDHWQQWFPEVDPVRQHLLERLARQRRIAVWRKRLEGEGLSAALVEFHQLDEALRKDVLKDRGVRQRILNHYLARVEALAKQDRYPQALSLVADARQLLDGDYKFRRTLQRTERRLKRSQAQRASAIVAKMRQRFRQGEGDLEALQALQRQLNEVDPGHPALVFPDLLRYYPQRIAKALGQESLSEAEKLLTVWKVLRPDDAKEENSQYSTLQARYQMLVKQQANRLQWKKRIESIVDEGDQAVLARLLDELPEGQRQTVLKEVEPKLRSFYRRNIEQSLQQSQFQQAQSLKESLAKLYSDPAIVKPLEQLIVQSRQNKMQSLTQNFKQMLQATPVDYQQLFASLSAMIRIDPASPSIMANMHDLRAHSLDLVENGRESLSSLEQLIAGWKSLASNYAPASDSLDETSNLIALRLLLKGRLLTAGGEAGKAVALFRFALTLQPVPTVRKSLQNELEKLKVPEEAMKKAEKNSHQVENFHYSFEN